MSPEILSEFIKRVKAIPDGDTFELSALEDIMKDLGLEFISYIGVKDE